MRGPSPPLLWGVGAEWENFGPGSCLISLSYLAFSLVKLSISEAFGGSRLSLSFGENELSWKLHYLPGLMRANFSHTTINSVKPFGNAQWSVSCSSVSAWHSLSQLSPELSLCDNSRLGLVSRRQDPKKPKNKRQFDGGFEKRLQIHTVLTIISLIVTLKLRLERDGFKTLLSLDNVVCVYTLYTHICICDLTNDEVAAIIISFPTFIFVCWGAAACACKQGGSGH